jgi:squalene-hopene/tetraprenyl-beta-curcumene cyclase
MKNPSLFSWSHCRSLAGQIIPACLVFCSSIDAGIGADIGTASPSTASISYRNELRHSIDRGLAWLETSQNSNGWWSTPDHPAMTALALNAFQGEPTGRYRNNEPAFMTRGYAYLLSCVQPDGGIHRTNLVTYNTSIAMLGLITARKTEFEPAILRARQFLVGLQSDFGEKGKLDSPYDGGIGYGSKYDHSDMGNTLQALEAIYYSKQLIKDKGATAAPDLNYNAAIHFLQSCQNLPSHNKESWASDAPENKGGFIYYPGHSMAGGTTNAATGQVALRSYGSISYAGLLSYIYAEMDRQDARVVAVFDWLRKYYTIEENPAMGQEGLFYYYHTMAKALTAYGVGELELADGRKVNWRMELSKRLLNLQRENGSWANGSARWWENDPVLVTSYVVQTLEIIHRGMEKAQ